MGSAHLLFMSILRDVLSVVRNMHSLRFVGVEAVFYGQLEQSEYLNLFHPLLAMLADVLLCNGKNSPSQMKRELLEHIEADLFRYVDFDTFLGISKAKAKNGAPMLRLSTSKDSLNVYQKRKRRSGLSGLTPDIAAFTVDFDPFAEAANAANGLSAMSEETDFDGNVSAEM